jgi:hypothetical protein
MWSLIYFKTFFGMPQVSCITAVAKVQRLAEDRPDLWNNNFIISTSQTLVPHAAYSRLKISEEYLERTLSVCSFVMHVLDLDIACESKDKKEDHRKATKDTLLLSSHKD